MRTDIHRPGCLAFDPEAYRCVGVFDGKPDPLSNEGPRRQQAVAALVDQGFRFGAGSSSQCGHCGTAIRYGALMVRDDVKEFIFVGEQCLDNRFMSLTKDQFHALRRQAKLNSERVKKADLVAQVLANNPGLEQALTTDHHIVDDIAYRLRNTGSISAKQIALVFKIQKQEAERAERRREQEAKAAALLAAGVQVPEGRVTVTGTVLSKKGQDTAYGFVVKMLVESDEGWKVWGTVPRSIEDDVERGVTVTFTATITRSDDDPVFGFFKRPTNPAVLATV